MAFSAAAGLTAAALAAGAILRFEAENALQDGPNYIESGQPEGAVPSIAQAIARQACRRYADGVPNLLDDVQVDFETVCRPYLDNIGYGGPPSVRLPFRGGQCPARYRVNFTGTGPTGIQGGDVCLGSASRDGFAELWGPIGALSEGEVICDGSQSQRGTRKLLSCFGFTNTPRLESPIQVQLGGISYPDFAISGVTLLDPGDDDCGNPDPVGEDPVPPPNPGPETEPYNPGPDVDIDITLNIDNEGLISVDLGLGPIIIAPFGGSGGGDPGDPGGPGDPPPGDVGDPGPAGETTEGGDLFSDAPPGSVLVGLKIDVLNAPVNAKQYEPGIYRGACYIYMGVPGLLDQDFGGSMLRTGQFFFAEKDNLTTWRVSANLGFNLRVTPYYREVES